MIGKIARPLGATGLDDETLEKALNTLSHTLYHPVATCRMGSDDASVVDPQLRVRGVDGLRVADASVMPAIIRGHTHAPSVLIGEKAADLIRGRLDAGVGLRRAPRAWPAPALAGPSSALFATARHRRSRPRW